MPKFHLGLDLGQARDFSALAILERESERISSVRHLQRFPLGAAYAEIVDRTRGTLSRPHLRGWSPLAVDATGVGRPVMDLFTARPVGCRATAITIHAGDEVGVGSNRFSVPKRDLVALLQVQLQRGRLKVASSLSAADLLMREMSDFRSSISETGHDSYGVWRTGGHDDLVLAVALALWHGNRVARLPDSPPVSDLFPDDGSPSPLDILFRGQEARVRDWDVFR